MAVYVNIKENDKLDKVCVISRSIIESLSLNPGKKYKLKFGQCEVPVTLSSFDDNSHSVFIGTDEFLKLGIPEDMITCITTDNDKIVLGPVLGVFVNPWYFKRIGNQSPPGGCTNIMKANENHHLFIYFFTIEGINWPQKKTECWYYSEKEKRWVKCITALPDIVYDRGVFNKRNEAKASQVRNNLISMYHISRINPGDCLDKYWLYEKLKKYKELKPYLPATVRFNSFEDLSKMLKKYKTLYLKSFYGSLGSEVMTVTKDSANTLRCSYFQSGEYKTSVVQDKSTFTELIKNFFKGKEFIVQQGIDLLKYNGSRVDMRVLIQKDGSGKWAFVYNVAFLGKKNALITAGEEKGAKPYNFMEIMPLILNMPVSKVRRINNEIVKVCKSIAEVIDKEYGAFGEIGMDMALDKKLKIWYIEANSKPDRELENTIIGDARCRISCIYIIEYTKYLAGFSDRSLETVK